jgi:5-formyltetrahydrofolate cyclo-ligase
VSQKLNKTQLRRLILQERQALPKNIWLQKSELLCQKLESNSLFQKSQTVLAYFSFRQEPDLSFLFTNKRRWGFPRCEEKHIHWHSWIPGESLQLSNYGILEPTKDSLSIDSSEVDLILVPALACDRFGYRLGYGGGFYDRMLSSPKWALKPTIGIIFDFAYLPELPINIWDSRLNYICTEKEFSKISE